MRMIAYQAQVDVPPEQAFSFVSDPHNWPAFLTQMVSVETSSDWGHVGGHACIVNRFLGRMVTSELELTEWAPPNRFRYTARQHGRPDLDNLRLLQPLDGGTRLIGTTTIARRRGAAGIADRVTMFALSRIFARATKRLPAAVTRRAQPSL